jgi:hypothetical protein
VEVVTAIWGEGRRSSLLCRPRFGDYKAFLDRCPLAVYRRAIYPLRVSIKGATGMTASRTLESSRATPERSVDDMVAAALGMIVVTGVYTDGWAHVNVGGLDTFFTPWHGLLYSSFLLLSVWVGYLTWRRWRAGLPGLAAIPPGYQLGVAGMVVFALGGFLDMLWHLAFGVEVGIDALVSPTHLLLLIGGVLLLTSPLRSGLTRLRAGRTAVLSRVTVVATATAAALVGFFLSYVSVFTEPGAIVPLTHIPESEPGHQAAELPAAAGLGGYLLTTLLLVLPYVLLRRAGRLPTGSITILVAFVALPAAALTQMTYASAALGSVTVAVLLDVALHRFELPARAVATLLPGLVWAGQLTGLALSGYLAWPIQLWAGVVVLSMLLSYLLASSGLPARHGRPE